MIQGIGQAPGIQIHIVQHGAHPPGHAMQAVGGGLQRGGQFVPSRLKRIQPLQQFLPVLRRRQAISDLAQGPSHGLQRRP